MKVISACAALFMFAGIPAWGETAEERRTAAEAELAAIKAEVALQAARYSALKGVFGEAPDIGRDGTVSITDSNSGFLLRNKVGSLVVMKDLAVQLCKELKDAKIGKPLFIAPNDLDAKLQGGQLIVSELEYLHSEISSAQALAGIPAMLSGLSVAKYGIDGIADILKMFRSNLTVTLSSTDRSAWLAHFVSAYCPDVLPVANTESVLKAKVASGAIKKLNEIVGYADSFDKAVAETTENIGRQEKLLTAELAKEKPDRAIVDSTRAYIESQRNALNGMNVNKGLVTRIKALNGFVSSKPADFLDALMWNEYRSEEYAKASRLVLALATQDSQLVKDNYFLGKRIYGQSAGELIYRVVDSDGKTKLAGFLTAAETLGKADFKASETSRCEALKNGSTSTSVCAGSQP